MTRIFYYSASLKPPIFKQDIIFSNSLSLSASLVKQQSKCVTVTQSYIPLSFTFHKR